MIQVASHQVQLAALVEACKRRQHLSRHTMASQVFTLGDSFIVGEEFWSGMAILTPDALFLLKVQRRNEPVARASIASETNLDFCGQPLISVAFTELPPLLTQDAGWPKPPSLDCEVAILLREQARQVRAVPFTTEVEFMSESARIRVSCSAMGVNMAAERLQGSGWIKRGEADVIAIQRSPVKNRTAYLMIAGMLAFVLATAIAIQMDSMSTQLTLLLSMPILAPVAYLALRYLGHLPSDPRDRPTGHH